MRSRQTKFIGNASADLASFDRRIRKLLGSFLGKCSGSIRSVVRHPQHQMIAPCGLDHIYGNLLLQVFLNQHRTGLVFDPGFSGEG
ncbi:hypothetical protein YC2023_052827 [Brassica napus]